MPLATTVNESFVLDFEFRSLEFVWDLGFGDWDFHRAIFKEPAGGKFLSKSPDPATIALTGGSCDSLNRKR
jgi:hypothetical protein